MCSNIVRWVIFFTLYSHNDSRRLSYSVREGYEVMLGGGGGGGGGGGVMTL